MCSGFARAITRPARNFRPARWSRPARRGRRARSGYTVLVRAALGVGQRVDGHAAELVVAQVQVGDRGVEHLAGVREIAGQRRRATAARPRVRASRRIRWCASVRPSRAATTGQIDREQVRQPRIVAAGGRASDATARARSCRGPGTDARPASASSSSASSACLRNSACGRCRAPDPCDRCVGRSRPAGGRSRTPAAAAMIARGRGAPPCRARRRRAEIASCIAFSWRGLLSDSSLSPAAADSRAAWCSATSAVLGSRQLLVDLAQLREQLEVLRGRGALGQRLQAALAARAPAPCCRPIFCSASR